MESILRAEAPEFRPDAFLVSKVGSAFERIKPKKEKKDRASPRKRRKKPKSVPLECDSYRLFSAGLVSWMHPLERCWLSMLDAGTHLPENKMLDSPSGRSSLGSMDSTSISRRGSDLAIVTLPPRSSLYELPGMCDELREEARERERWKEWAIHAAEKERQRRIEVLKQIEEQEQQERTRRRAWALHAIEEEQRLRVSQEFISTMASTQWFNDMISSFNEEYELTCPYSNQGCKHTCLRKDLEHHLSEECCFAAGLDHIPHDLNDMYADPTEYEVVCPNTVLGCTETCFRGSLATHLQKCRFRGPSRLEENEERAYWKKVVLQQAEVERARRVAVADQKRQSVINKEHEDAGKEKLESPQDETNVKGSALHVSEQGGLHTLLQQQLESTLIVLHEEVIEFAKQCRAHQRKQVPLQTWAMEQIRAAVTVLWGPSVIVEPYGSAVSGLMTPDSDLDLVVFLPENEASFTNSAEPGPQVSRIQQLAVHLEQQPWISVEKVIELTAVPLIKAKISRYEGDKITGEIDESSTVIVDLSLASPLKSHLGLATTALVGRLVAALPSLAPLVLVVKRFLKLWNLDEPATGGLSSYALTLMVTYLLLHQLEHHKQTGPSSCFETVRQVSGLKKELSDLSKENKNDSIRSTEIRDAFKCSPSNVDDQQGVFGPAPECIYKQPQSPSLKSYIAHQYWTGCEMASSLLMQKSDFLREFTRPKFYDISVNEEELNNKDSVPSVMLGKLLMDFLHLFGEDFEAGSEGLSVRGGGFRFQCKHPPVHPLAADPIIVEDPLDVRNNVARSTYRISQIQKLFSDALSTLKSLIARFNDTNSISSSIKSGYSNHGVLSQIFCANKNKNLDPTIPEICSFSILT